MLREDPVEAVSDTRLGVVAARSSGLTVVAVATGEYGVETPPIAQPDPSIENRVLRLDALPHFLNQRKKTLG